MAGVTIKQLLEAGVHFGHQTRRWNPKMKPYIYGERNGIHIIDLRQTLAQVEAAVRISERARLPGRHSSIRWDQEAGAGADRGGRQLCRHALCQFPVAGRHAHELRHHPKAHLLHEGTRAHGVLERVAALSKRERLSISRELGKLQQTLGGVREMTKAPDAIFIVDVNTEHTAVKEAARLGITTLALVDSNCDPDHIDFVIAGNDDAIRAAALVAGALAEACRAGKGVDQKESDFEVEDA